MSGKRYTKEFKEKVVKYYFDHPGLGYLSVAREFNISSDESVRRWVKTKEAEGDQAFLPKKPKSKSRKKKVQKPTSILSTENWDNPKDAQERIAFLEAENAYLKKLVVLRKEE